MISPAFLKNAALDLLFPVSCFGCNTEGQLFCRGCHDSLDAIPPLCVVCRALVPARGRVPAGRTCRNCRKKSFIYAFLSPFSYQDDLIRDLIHGLKYGRVRDVAPILAGLVGSYIVRQRISFPRRSILVPMPLHKIRERTRGFNQSFLIAAGLADFLGFDVRAEVLERYKDTKPQVDLSRSQRMENVKNAFIAPNKSLVQDRVILLLDDVVTTGATLEEAARTLKEAGAKRVWAITVAH